MKCKQKIKQTFQLSPSVKQKAVQNVKVYEHNPKPKDTQDYIQKPIPRTVSKSYKNHITPCKNKLFISAEYLPLITESNNQNPYKINKKSLPQGHNKRKDDESTASRQFKIKQNYPTQHNPQYFSNSVLSFTSTLQKRNKNNNKNHNKNKQQKYMSNSAKMIESLKNKINTYARLNNLHKRQSASLQSEVNEKQMHRLRTIQSTQKLCLVEDIISIQKRLLKNRI